MRGGEAGAGAAARLWREGVSGLFLCWRVGVGDGGGEARGRGWDGMGLGDLQDADDALGICGGGCTGHCEECENVGVGVYISGCCRGTAGYI